MFDFFFFKQKTAYYVRISDWSSDVCSSDLQHSRAGASVDDLDLPAAAVAADDEILLQRRPVRRAGTRVGRLDVEGQGFAERDLVAIDPGAHLRLRGETGSEQQQAGQRRVPAWHQRSPVFRRRSYSSRNLARSRPPGSSGTRRSQASLARCFSRSAALCVAACSPACGVPSSARSPFSCLFSNACCMRARCSASALRCASASAGCGVESGCDGCCCSSPASPGFSWSDSSCASREPDPEDDGGCWPDLSSGSGASSFGLPLSGFSCSSPRPPDCCEGGGLRFIAASTSLRLAIASAMSGCCTSAWS